MRELVTPELPIGVVHFHRNPFIDYQLNRVYGEGWVPRDALEPAAREIRGLDDAPPVFLRLADRAEADGRLFHATGYLRLAEFFTQPTSSAERPVYERFLAVFSRATAHERLERHHVAYGDAVLPAWQLRALGPAKGTIVFFGGFDSLIEEFYPIWARLAEAGFDVIAFDGPGQGGARLLHHVVFDHDWEKPVGAILDHFGLLDVTLIGVSMGGYWAIRAAAFESRVARVVAWPPVYDWLSRFSPLVRRMIRAMVNRRRFIDWSIRVRMQLFPIMRHVVSQTLYIQGAEAPIDAATWFLGMNAEHLHSERIEQPVLLMIGEHDAFQSPKLARAQEQALTRSQRVTSRVFTEAEHAASHCQMGNLKLAIDTVTRWLDAPADTA